LALAAAIALMCFAGAASEINEGTTVKIYLPGFVRHR
jgi:hypothetical protein